MEARKEVSSGLTESWLKLARSWTGADADVFYQEYVLKMLEMATDFESSCMRLGEISDMLSKELTVIERSLES